MTTTPQVKESVGECLICVKRRELGGGICMECWDKLAEHPAALAFFTSLKDSSDVINGEKLPPRYFTRREMEIFYYVSKGYHNQAIADKLCVSLKTVEDLVTRLLHKVIIPRWANKRVWIAVNAKRFWEKRGEK